MVLLPIVDVVHALLDAVDLVVDLVDRGCNRLDQADDFIFQGGDVVLHACDVVARGHGRHHLLHHLRESGHGGFVSSGRGRWHEHGSRRCSDNC